jgi:hypothetical protein
MPNIRHKIKVKDAWHYMGSTKQGVHDVVRKGYISIYISIIYISYIEGDVSISNIAYIITISCPFHLNMPPDVNTSGKASAQILHLPL